MEGLVNIPEIHRGTIQIERKVVPLTSKGKKVLANYEKEYGAEKGKSYFYASINKGTLTGVHKPHPEVEDVHKRNRQRR